MKHGPEKKICFVISPIGDDDSNTRKHSDQVLKHIIIGAVEQMGYEVIRADKISEPGIITHQILQHIVDSPLVVADLTERNPNVFYELAFRHAIRKPLVQLIKKGELIPFDVAATRVIKFDLQNPDSIEAAKLGIVAQVKSFEGGKKDTDNPISVFLDLKVLKDSRDPWERSLGREAFPGPKIAEAWVYTVVNPIINAVEWEGRYLAKEQWGFDRWHQDRLEFVKTITDNMSGNYRQFFQHNKEIYDLVKNHDEKVRSFIEIVKLCYLSISQSAALEEVCENVTSLDSMQKLQDKSICPEYYDFKDFQTREQFIDKLFSPRESDDVKLTLAEYVLKNAPKLPTNITFAPLWNLFHNDFVLLREKIFANEVRQLTEFNSILREINAKLLATLMEEQSRLCYQYHIPPDEPPPTVVQAPSGRFT